MDDLKERLNRIHDHCRNYQTPVISRSVGQAILNFTLYSLICGVMIFCATHNLAWVTLLLSLPAAGLLIRLFIIQHDCGHGSYFKSSQANTFLGRMTSIFTLTPYAFWRDAHNKHHASSGNLCRRGIGGIDTLTVQEFEALSSWRKFTYKLYRHPIVILLIGPPLHIMVLQRFPLTSPMPFFDHYQTIHGAHLWRSVMALNVGIVIFYGSLSFFFGLSAVLLTFLPIMILSACMGGWLFYVQHQYEDTYWAPKEDWDYQTAALLGSSHYDLPKLLQWFTGNIGFHHIHHLSSLIPNYRLQECYDASRDLQLFPKMSIRQSLKSARLRLWDDTQKKMVGV